MPHCRQCSPIPTSDRIFKYKGGRTASEVQTAYLRRCGDIHDLSDRLLGAATRVIERALAEHGTEDGFERARLGTARVRGAQGVQRVLRDTLARHGLDKRFSPLGAQAVR